MTAQVNFFASESDQLELVARARSLGLVLIKEVWPVGGSPEIRDSVGPGVFAFSAVGVADLHPYEAMPKGSGLMRVSHATDPVLEFISSRIEDGAIVAGRIWWSDYPPELAKVTRRPFRALQRWISGRWAKRSDGFYVGSAAQGLISGGMEALYVPRSVVIEQHKY